MKSNQHRIAVILAGGKSRRMDNIDKANFELAGRRLIDWVYERVKPQTDETLLSAASDLGTGLTFIPDQPETLAGPVAGLWAVADWVDTHRPTAKGFFTVPVDAPAISRDLFDYLSRESGSSIAETASGLHPTFGYWEIKPLLKTLKAVPSGETLSLKALAERMGAVHVKFQDERNFSNINTRQDAEVFELKS